MLKTAQKAALAAGQILKRDYYKQAKVSFKKDYSPVTETDLAAEKKIISVLKKNFPSHKIFSEEEGFSKNNSDYLWIIDPLDGTTNFSRHIPYFCVSIALTYTGELILGVIYDPLHDELFSAEKNKGCYFQKNPTEPDSVGFSGKKIFRREADELQSQTISLARGQGPMARNRLAKILNKIARVAKSVRMPGATALNLAHLADNRFDSLINSDCNFYDCAAGCLIAQEAGVTITDFSGKKWQLKGDERTDILAADRKYVDQYINLLKNI